jgi:peptide/nickel transport system substrate-binding protein
MVASLVHDLDLSSPIPEPKRLRPARSWRQTRTALTVAAVLAAGPALAQGTVTVAMTAGDLPITTGVPDQGFEGYRFVGLSLYDALTGWDLSSAEKASGLVPALATSWHVDPANNKRWIFKLREGVTFHDGCAFTADDVVWNLQRYTDRGVPQFETFQYAIARAYLTSYAGVEKIDAFTVAIETKTPDSLFPYPLSLIPMISRCRAEALKYDWTAYATQPSGTGPYRFVKSTPRERMEFVANKDYWDKARVPKHDRLVLVPMPEASTRVAALLSGQVNFAEAPPPDSVPRLKAAGMNVLTNVYPHNWGYQLNFVSGPFTDLRVRRAANYAINRADVKEMLNGMMEEGYSTIPPSTPYFGNPILYKYDPAKAAALLKEAGCLPCNITLAISTSGSGQMQPLPMNELVKSELEAVGFKVNFDVMDWAALGDVGRGGPDKYPKTDGVNISRAAMDPFYGLIRHVAKSQWSPAGSNWGHYEDATVEKLVLEITGEFDEGKRLTLLKSLNERMNDQAVMIWVAHDVNPRVLSPKLHGFVQAQSWFQDLTRITVSP